MREKIPWIMASARVALGPLLITGARCNWSGTALAGMVLTALFSDIYDGVLARRWHCDTAALRLFDSMADTVFYLCVAWTLWIARPQAIRENAALLLTIAFFEALRYAFDFGKFGKPASYHSWLAKTWGLSMAIAVMLLLARPGRCWMWPLSLMVGLACNVEGLAMSLLLPQWTRDVRSISRALALRSALLQRPSPTRTFSPDIDAGSIRLADPAC